MRVTLINHGSIIRSREGSVPGFNAQLSEKGYVEANAFAQELNTAAIETHAIYHSTAPRANETTSIILKTYLISNIYPDSRLDPFGVGKYEGMMANEVDWNKTPKGGESPGDFLSRTSEVFEEITKLQSGENILIVSHKGNLAKLIDMLNHNGFAPSDKTFSSNLVYGIFCSE